MTFKLMSTFLVLVLGLGAPAAAGEVQAESANQAKMSLPLEKGQYFFIGSFKGNKGKHELRHGIVPIIFNRIAPESEQSGWQLRFESTGDTSKLMWSFDVDIAFQASSNAMMNRLELRWTDAVPEGAVGVRILPMEKRGVGDDGKPSFRLYQIPYVAVDGETRYVLIAIGDDIEAFRAAIKIPKSYFMWNWAPRDGIK